MTDELKVRWRIQPDQHDYPAAMDFLTLLSGQNSATSMVSALRVAPDEHRKAKDILRASRLPLLPHDNPHVHKDLKKVEDGEELSPILLVRGDLFRDIPLVIADGYHRVCASYIVDENTDIPCRIVDAVAFH
jgi:hypothetical protein